ncbi:hypothetical protein Glove_344g7 [Diversispora epigaea]|uniref:Integrase catalytic domain-containing protein n=1 Tax=Diversispora epigaea TaxID=1348612 RepID=A0A397HJ11_9GLOM|nr:hypothetical protein Glove_344g7 [Diversispora epigaea]
MLPVISIDSRKARELDISIDLQKIYYHPSGYQRTSKKLYEVSQKAGFDFTLTEVQEWVERQALHQIHMPRPKSRFIPCVSFSNITVPFHIIQGDTCYMSHHQVKNQIYKYALNCIDIASLLEKLFKSRYCPRIFMVDKGTEFRGEVIFLANKYNVKIYIARNKESMGIVERFNRSFEEYIYLIQDAVEMRLPPGERCRDWIDNAPIFLKQYDNSVNRMIGMSPAEARKKKHVYRLASKPRKGPMGFDEEKLPFHVSVRYLLKPGELEGGRRRVTDMNWSPQIYRIKERLS